MIVTCCGSANWAGLGIALVEGMIVGVADRVGIVDGIEGPPVPEPQLPKTKTKSIARDVRVMRRLASLGFQPSIPAAPSLLCGPQRLDYQGWQKLGATQNKNRHAN
jgi:hypothetical protein